MRDVFAHDRHGPAQPSSMAGAKSVSASEPGPPVTSPDWTAPLPAYGAYSKQWTTAEDQQRAAQIADQQRQELAAIEAKLDRGKSNKVRSEFDPVKAYDDGVPSLHRDKPK
jgi:hypothetical protein